MATAPPTVGDIGENALIERIQRRIATAAIPSPTGFNLRLGPGDDAAAWTLNPPSAEIASTDAIVEGVHFRRETSNWNDIGWKACASNLSDIAAMGAEPLAALITLGLPPQLPLSALDDLYSGILDACAAYPTTPIGGDIVASPVLFIAITITGRPHGQPLTRAAAKPGDAIAVAGPLGASRGGLLLLESSQPINNHHRRQLANAHRRPHPQLDAARILQNHRVRCAMDISDGLAADLPKLASAAGLAARIDPARIPPHPALIAEFGNEALPLALAGGEDYQLLFTAPPPVARAILAQLPGAAIIGEIVHGEPGSVTIANQNETLLSLAAPIWEHFRSNNPPTH